MHYIIHIYNKGYYEVVVKRGIYELYFEANYGNMILLYHLYGNNISRINA